MTESAVPLDVLDALGILNRYARERGTPSGLRRAIYDYKTLAATVLVKKGQAAVRFVRWTGKCNRCNNGRFTHWSWDDNYTVACRDCSGSGRRTLKFSETTLPDGQIWHHPWFTGNGRGWEIARLAMPSLILSDTGEYEDGEGNLVEWHDPGEWAPNLPGEDLSRDELVVFLNFVEDWIESYDGGGWVAKEARAHLCCHQYRNCYPREPRHDYTLDLGRAPGGCFVCDTDDDLAGFGYGRITPLFHWSLPVCRKHGEGPEKVPFPKDPPPDALLTPEILRWQARHARVVEVA